MKFVFMRFIMVCLVTADFTVSIFYMIIDTMFITTFFSSTKRFGAERSEGPNRVAREKFNNILSTCFTREIKLLCGASLNFLLPFCIYLSFNQDHQYLSWLVQFCIGWVC